MAVGRRNWIVDSTKPSAQKPGFVAKDAVSRIPLRQLALHRSEELSDDALTCYRGESLNRRSRGIHRARKGSASNHEIICRTHTRRGNSRACAESPSRR
jgi:hypothetical protein